MGPVAALKVHLNYDHDNDNCLIRFLCEVNLTSNVKVKEEGGRTLRHVYSRYHVSNCAQSLRYRICPLKLTNNTNSTLGFQVSGEH